MTSRRQSHMPSHVEPRYVHAAAGERLELVGPCEEGGADGAYELGAKSILPELGLDDGINLDGGGGGVVGRGRRRRRCRWRRRGWRGFDRNRRQSL
ncbi:hypothetical protein ACLB2K_047535 [Fragaria x ananassa]